MENTKAEKLIQELEKIKARWYGRPFHFLIYFNPFVLRQFILAWRIRKVKRYLQHWRVDNSKRLTVEEWTANDNACLYLHRFEKKLRDELPK